MVEIPAPRLGALTGYLESPSRRALGALKQRANAALEEVLKDNFGGILADLAPDLVIADCEHHSAILQSVSAGHRILLLSFIYQTPPAPQMPPANSAAIPGRGITGSPLGIAASWAVLAAKKRAALLRASWRHWGGDFTTAHRVVAQRLGVDLAAVTTRRGFQMPWGYTLPTLFLLSGHADFPARLRANQSYAGPMILEDRPGDPDDKTASTFAAGAPDTTRIYAAFGSIRRPPPKFLSALIEVARRNPQMRFLIADRSTDPYTLDIPANAEIVPWAPQLEALAAADCAIFHGGAGTLNECLATATPMLIYPDALDGRGNGARVEYHGLGSVGSYADSADMIEAKLKSILADKAIRTNLADQLRHIDTARESRVAERTVEALLAEPKGA